MWSGRATEAQGSRGLNVVLSKLWDLIKTHFIVKPVPLNHYLHILLDLRPSHLTVIKISMALVVLACCFRVSTGQGLGARSQSRCNTPVCADLLLMLTLMAKSNNPSHQGRQPLCSCLSAESNTTEGSVALTLQRRCCPAQTGGRCCSGTCCRPLGWNLPGGWSHSAEDNSDMVTYCTFPLCVQNKGQQVDNWGGTLDEKIYSVCWFRLMLLCHMFSGLPPLHTVQKQIFNKSWCALRFKKHSQELFIELSEANRCDKDTACWAAGSSVVPARYRAEPNALRAGREKKMRQDAQGEGYAGQAPLKVSDSFQRPWCELRCECAFARECLRD